SAEMNSPWPDENRFHFQIFDLPPVLVTKLGIRTRETFFVFGIPEENSGTPNQLWRSVGSDDGLLDKQGFFFRRLHLYSLQRGVSKYAGFLVSSDYGGCAGSLGVSYEAREWHPEGIGDLDLMIKQDGALGLDDKVPGFPQIGELRTKGPLITLPYCWFSE